MNINYTSSSIAPKLKLFICEKLRATLSHHSCSNHYENGRYIQCICCPIGKYHESEVIKKSSVISPKNMAPNPACTRCQKTGRRLVFKKTLCISCANREYEVCKGKNSKGTEPILALSRLRRVEVTVINKGTEFTWEGFVIDEFEACRMIERLYFGASISSVIFDEPIEGRHHPKK